MIGKQIKIFIIILLCFALAVFTATIIKDASASYDSEDGNYEIAVSSNGSGTGFQWIILNKETGKWYRYEKPEIGTSQLYFHSGSADGRELSEGELWEFRFFRSSR